MELGEKLKKQRIEAGLSQRQLCDGIVTRNMLSQIENGSARPSMKTLSLLAERLGKNVSFFLEESAVLSPNQQIMESARAEFDAKHYEKTIEVLGNYQEPDPVYDREYAILWNLCHLNFALEQMEFGKTRFALDLLERADKKVVYLEQALERKRLLLRAKLTGKPVAAQLPSLDEELMLRAEEAATAERAERLLDAAEDQDNEQWNYLRGKVYFEKKQYAEAAACLHKAENRNLKKTAQMLEICYRELGDFKQAYFYACKQK